MIWPAERIPTGRVENFLKDDATLTWTINAYHKDQTQIGSPTFIVDNLSKVAKAVKDFGDAVSANRLFLYGADKRLLLNEKEIPRWLVSDAKLVTKENAAQITPLF